jgi:hypothetical protein
MNPSLNSVWGRRLLTAMLTWLVPFLIAVPFYSKNGTLLIDLSLFKSIMIVVATVTAAVLMVWLFRLVTTAYTREAVITGLVWITINWVLDTIVLVGLLGMTPLEYITQIGVRYLMIPAMVIAAGIIADDAAQLDKHQKDTRG